MIQWALYPMTCVLSIDIQRKPCDSGGRDWSGVIQTAIKDASYPQKLKVLRNRSSRRMSGGSVSLPTPEFQTSGLQNCQHKFLLFDATQVYSDFLWKSQESQYTHEVDAIIIHILQMRKLTLRKVERDIQGCLVVNGRAKIGIQAIYLHSPHPHPYITSLIQLLSI